MRPASPGATQGPPWAQQYKLGCRADSSSSPRRLNTQPLDGERPVAAGGPWLAGEARPQAYVTFSGATSPGLRWGSPGSPQSPQDQRGLSAAQESGDTGLSPVPPRITREAEQAPVVSAWKMKGSCTAPIY